jgi:hypothetical protein
MAPPSAHWFHKLLSLIERMIVGSWAFARERGATTLSWLMILALTLGLAWFPSALLHLWGKLSQISVWYTPDNLLVGDVPQDLHVYRAFTDQMITVSVWGMALGAIMTIVGSILVAIRLCDHEQ